MIGNNNNTGLTINDVRRLPFQRTLNTVILKQYERHLNFEKARKYLGLRTKCEHELEGTGQIVCSATRGYLSPLKIASQHEGGK